MDLSSPQNSGSAFAQLWLDVKVVKIDGFPEMWTKPISERSPKISTLEQFKNARRQTTLESNSAVALLR
jgi:hypothetical protein